MKHLNLSLISRETAELKKTGGTVGNFLLLLVCVCLMFACDTMQSSYEKALKADTIEGYEKYLQKYPGSVHAKEIKSLIDTRESQSHDNFLEVMNLMKTKTYSDPELIEKIDNLCMNPPTSISYSNYRLFQNSIVSFMEIVADTSKVENSEIVSHTLYSYAEFFYYFLNAVSRNSMSIMMESFTELDYRNVLTIDLVALSKLAQTILDFQYAAMIFDDDAISRHRALMGIDRITSKNPLELSKKWSSGKSISGFQVMGSGIPISLGNLRETLKIMSDIETDKNNQELINKIQNRLDNIPKKFLL